MWENARATVFLNVMSVWRHSGNLVLRKVTRGKSPGCYFQPLPQPVMRSLLFCPSDGRQGIQDTCGVLVEDFSFNDNNFKNKNPPKAGVIWKSD